LSIMSIGLYLLRFTLGLIMAAHGAQKLFGWFGGGGPAGTGASMEKLGFRPGRTHATVVGAAELTAGVLVVLGLFTPLAAAIVIAVMFTAIATVHVRKGFFATNGGYEFNLLLAATALCFAFTGPGVLSFDYAAGTYWWGIASGLFALFAGIVGGSVALVLRRTTRPIETTPTPPSPRPPQPSA
jgi:putative oxidoreductase